MVVRHRLSLVCPPQNDQMCDVQDFEQSCSCADDICCFKMYLKNKMVTYAFIKYHINGRTLITVS